MFKYILATLTLLLSMQATYGSEEILQFYQKVTTEKITPIDECPTGVPDTVYWHCTTYPGSYRTEIQVSSVINLNAVLEHHGCLDNPLECITSPAVTECMTHPIGLYPQRPDFHTIISIRSPTDLGPEGEPVDGAPYVLLHPKEALYEPHVTSKGMVGRLYLAFEALDCITLDSNQRKVYNAWDTTYPPTSGEIQRELFNGVTFGSSNPLVLDYKSGHEPCNVHPGFVICRDSITDGVKVHQFTGKLGEL